MPIFIQIHETSAIWLGVASLVGALIGAGVPSIWSFLSRKEQYQVKTFEKRLEVYQQAFSWNEEAYGAINSTGEDRRRPSWDSGKKFYYANSLYLDKKTRQSLMTAVNAVKDTFIVTNRDRST